MAKKSKKIPTSRFFRVGKILRTTGYILGKEVASRVQSKLGIEDIAANLESKKKQAIEIVKTLSQLRGAALKVGQMLSLEFSDMLPQEVVKILRKMHDQSEFMDIKTVKNILSKELGDNQKLIENLSEEPIAAASIGQVHTATYAGNEIVLKIQYPKVGKSVSSDMKTLKSLVSLFLKSTNKSIDLDEVFQELESNFKKELDYKREATQLTKYRELFAPYKKYKVPLVYEEVSSKRVLAMEKMDGVRLGDYTESQGYDAGFYADAFLNLLFLEFFEFGLVQTDPNPGNFLIQSKEQKLVLLDLGSHKKYSKKTRKNVIELLKTTLKGNSSEILIVAKSLELLDERESDETKDLFVAMMRKIVEIFSEETQPFEFSNEAYLKEIRNLSVSFVRAVKFSKPSKDLMFLNRKLGGAYHVLKNGNVHCDVSVYWDKILQGSL